MEEKNLQGQPLSEAEAEQVTGGGGWLSLKAKKAASDMLRDRLEKEKAQQEGK